ncbi:hypothetical protein [Rhizobium sp. Root483D2]|uniref:hypothetical protein n=1 Tax=Rhizobium sp. Root483D2 TaxID=1736545 RepID=UPI000715DD7F|nr:hypothetical protein [Rhizobium sp. Root483D2]KQY49044.1 hypothetical protein ASD32_01775 [Rhizobium sp. Root483D2]
MSIVFSGVHKTLRQKSRKTIVLEDVEAVFEGDRVTGVLAAPGTGKSTLIALATGKLMPDKGRVKRSSNISFPVGGGGVFHGMLTARENIAFLCRVAGFDPLPIIKFIMEFADLDKKVMDRNFNTLNRDERTRVIFTTVYAMPYEFYLIDEVIIGGRGAFREKCKILAEEKMQKSGFLIATSSPAVLKNYCQDLAVLHDGTVTSVDSLEEAENMLGVGKLKDGDGSAEHATDDIVDTHLPI